MIFSRRANFLIIGAQKCGTSSLYAYLTANLMIEPAGRKELHYFDLFYERGRSWYQKHFEFNRHRITGEATPFYLMHPDAPMRVKRYNTGIKLLVILRDPAERAWSHYQMNAAAGIEPLSFGEALDAEKERLANAENLSAPDSQFLRYSYKTRGLYADQLDRWHTCFKPEQFCLVNHHRFFSHPWQEIQRVYRFLEVAPFYGTQLFHNNAGSNKPLAPAREIQKLKEYFREPNQRLAEQYKVYFD